MAVDVHDEPRPPEPVAVVGIACRLPGAPDPGAFWQLLREGRGAVAEAPADRWSDAPVRLRRGGFLDRVEDFDADFFGVTPREAAAMDPQQRLALELGWESLENARIVPSRLRGTRFGIFFGAVADDYARLTAGAGPDAVSPHTLAGLGRSLIANRLSYLLGARGASMTVDTGQSSSLVAVHLACESLRSGQCDLALAGGVQLNLSGAATADVERFGALSPDGECFTFDARANGYVRGEGGAVVVLKPLRRALADGDDIWCVIRGGAVNNDGGGPGLTHPEPDAQREVIEEAYRQAGVDPAAVQYVELHGTGTRAGDPVEAEALGAALGALRPAARPLHVGSVKTNVGHLEAAAGITGLLKVVLALREGELPASRNYRTPNPRIPMDEWRLRVHDRLGPWPSPEAPLIAGVSSFGMGGTNCHLVLAAAPDPADLPGATAAAPADACAAPAPGSGPAPAGAPAAASAQDPAPAGHALPLPYAVSGRDAEALRAQARHLARWVAERPDVPPAALAASLLTTRTAFPARAVVVAGDRATLRTRLDALGRGAEGAGTAVGQATGGDVAVLFSGQGAQRPGMGRELYAAHPAFAAAFDEVCAHFDTLLDRPLREVLWAGPGSPDAEAVHRTEYAQPGLFAIEVALHRFVTGLGVRPALLLGHSIGELAAAHVAGVLTLPDACALVAARGRLMQALPGGGAMAAVEAGEDEVRAALDHDGLTDRVSVAAVNGPRAVVISGDAEAVDGLAEGWRAEGRRTRRLRVSHAFHSPRMEGMLDAFRTVAESLSYAPPRLPVVSDLTGDIATAAELCDPAYWVRHVRDSVRFADGVRRLDAAGVTTYLELGPDTVLTAAARSTVPGGRRFLGALRAGRPEPETLVEALAGLHVAGAEVDLTALTGRGGHVALPTYAFRRRRHWLPAASAAGQAASGGAVPEPEETAVAAPVPGDRGPAAPVSEAAAPAGSGTGQATPAARSASPPGPAASAGATSGGTAQAAPASAAPPTPSADADRRHARPAEDPLDLVRRHTAAVIGSDAPGEIPADAAFRDIGVTSIIAVELRDRLAAATGRALPETLVFEYPTPGRLARHLSTGADTADELPAAAESGGADDDPVVIVGMACRFPGGVRSPEDLWRIVADGVDAIGPFPTDRGWDVDRLYDPDPRRRGSSYVREGGFLAGIAEFDAAFFGISPREAAALDPQQRLLLETSWESLERSGIDPGSLRDSNTGVFVGATFQEYGPRMGEDSEGSDGYLYTGTTPSVASGRIAYVLGLRGPAVTVDTACSASLVALHTAARSLRAGECALALAGGVTVMPTAGVFAELSRLGGLSPDGRSKAFSAAADGTGWAEGAGMLVLERLSAARRHGHPVLAVLRGSAINSDGASNGLTAPNGAAQRHVIRAALRTANLTGADVDAVEAHGTGTRLGDPIEANALLETYGQDRPEGRPLWLGSLKSNIGHTQSAAGVAGVIKMTMALRHGVLPRTLHADVPSPSVDWSAGTVRLLTEPVDWAGGEGRPRRAGVSSFGISGTNAHLILEEAPPPADPEPPRAPAGPVAWPLSAKTPAALRAQAAQLLDHLAAHPGTNPADVAFSLAHGRADFPHRAVAVATGHDGFAAALQALATDTPAAGVVHGTAADHGRVAFVFPGHGSQWPGMANALYEQAPAFADKLRECAAVIDPLVGWSLLDTVLGREGAADQQHSDVAQPVLFSVMVSLAALWEAHGVRPAAVVGHSQGELAAACVAGVLTLEDAATVVVRRSRLFAQELPGRGMMAAVELSADGVRRRIAERNAPVDLAVVNGPAAVTVAGEPDEIERFVADCKADGIRARVVVRAGASHCALVEPLREPLRELLDGVPHHPPRIALYSTVTGGPLGADDLNPGYWFRNAREPVDFQAAVVALLGHGHRAFVECSPHPLLLSALLDTADETGHQPAAVGTLRRGEGGRERFLRSLAEAHVRGLAVDWDAPLDGTGARRTDLPTYPFQRRHHWLSPATGPSDVAAAGLAPADHPLLGAVLTAVDGDRTVLTGRLSPRSPAWLADHAVGGTALMPGTAYVEVALRAGDEVGCSGIEELTVERPLLLPEGTAVQLRVTVGALDAHRTRPVEVHARPDTGDDEPWTRHATGSLTTAAPSPRPPAAWPPPGAEPVDVTAFYADREADGYGYGPAFRGLRAAWRLGDEMYAEVALDQAHHADARRYAVHPALLDAALHAELLRTPATGAGTVRLPFTWSGVRVPAAGATTLRVRVAPAGGDAVSVTATDPAGRPVAAVDSLLMRPVPAAGLTAVTPGGGALYALDWQPLPAGAATAAGAGLRIVTPADDAAGPGGLPDAGAAAPRAGYGLGSGDLPDAAPPAGQALGPGDLPEATDAAPAAGRGAAHARATAARGLTALHAWLADEHSPAARLVVLTRGAVAVRGPADVSDPAGAALWGLVRSAQAEHPDQFVLVDADAAADEAAVRRAAALAVAAGENQAAIRDGAILVPRLVRTAGAGRTAADPTGTHLITGGLGSLGGDLARHLVAAGARHLVLTGRRGADTPGAAELAAELTAAGADVSVRACDVADRAALAAVIDGIPATHPLTGVYHLAGAADDAPLDAMTPERLDAVLRPKADGAVHLDELTRDLPLTAFVLFSSAVGVLGLPAQSGYAAANTFLDALAHRRRARGVPGVSLAWGLWERPSGLGSLADADLARLRRSGLAPMSTADGLALFAAALGGDRTLVVPARLDLAALRNRAGENALAPLLRGLVRAPARALTTETAEVSGEAGRLAGLSRADQDRHLLDLVRGHAATALGYDAADRDTIHPDRAFRESGFDSLTVVELRNRLRSATGLPLPATLLFDYPTPAALAAHLRERLLGDAPDPAAEAGGTTTAAAPDGEDPIAIVAMAGRFPGDVRGPEDLWRLVGDGADAIGEFPTDRGWDTARLFAEDPEGTGRSATRHGGFLYDAGHFDAALFGISPREALAMDPQQRLLLEVAWETWERAGIPVADIRESSTGVFMGVAYHDYAARAERLPDGVEGYLMTGSAGSVASGRIAYTFGLRGPAITVDTACSSSLVALHLAVQALRNGECAMALAGGVSVMATPTTFVEFSRQQGLAADGRCKSYGAGADGTGWSEGVGVLLVEKLSDARRLGHPVVGVVRGSALNQDGSSNGLTAPSGPAQERVIRAAWADAGITGADVDVVEGHGTGTRLGDPIEAQALLATYGRDRGDQGPLWLGSLKSNIGHTQAAAGVAGVIKVLQAMRYERMPRTLHAEEPTPEVDWAAGDVRLLAEARPWPRTPDRVRRAGVSSFGISGTNAHVIIEEPPAEPVPEPAEPAETGTPALPFVVSAGSAAALRGQVERLSTRLGEGTADPLDVAYSLAVSRSPLAYRTAVVAHTSAEAVERLDRATSDLASADRRVAVVFSGQGARRAAPGRALSAAFPVFRRVFADVCGRFSPELARTLWSGDGAEQERTEVAQPALFAYQVALFRLVESWGVRPSVVAGHSVGEIAAAHVAGVLSLDDAVVLVGERARLMGELPEGGVMVAVAASEERVRALLTEEVAVAAVNGPESVVVSGAEAAVEAVVAGLGEVRHRRLRVSHAFHSPLMDPMLDAFAAALREVTLSEPRMPVVSGLLGRPVEPGELSDPGYWVRHVREPVRFADAVAAMRADGVDVFVEAGPDGTLTGLLTEVPVAVPLVRRDADEADGAVSALTRLFTAGVPVDWEGFFAGRGARPTDLPTYAFDHQHYWIADGAPPATVAAAPTAAPTDPGFRERLAGLPAADRGPYVLQAVCEQTAAVLGHADPGAVDPERPFHEMGFDSLTAVELRNRINRLSGLALSATLVFDHPTPAALAEHLHTELRPGPDPAPDDPAPDDPSLDDLFAYVDSELGPEAE
ncbi:type I polyketide synthase [Streptomyces hygroscopicus]|uniref:type I polyketide synthase n=5 Tax=Streptomyces hygroscopicus TaxID=1912 RepID=UPI003795D434